MAVTPDYIAVVDESKMDIDAQILHQRETRWDKFDNKMKSFAMSYATHYNHRAAAEEAGFPKSSGLQLVRNPLIQALVSDLVLQKQLRTGVTDDFVATMWMKILPMLMGDQESPLVNSLGEAVQVKKFFATETVAALREMSKITTTTLAAGEGVGLDEDDYNLFKRGGK